ncbi:ferredoxin [Ichthyobacterium seriolicida]|nr:ferredoxin [Ichthyobacterium seriolicida]
MVIITFNRDRCIGCNYCADLCPANWKMNRKDGKSTLIKSVNKNRIHVLKTYDESVYDDNKNVAEICPVKIINVIKINK